MGGVVTAARSPEGPERVDLPAVADVRPQVSARGGGRSRPAIFERMGEQVERRVTVTLPGGHAIEGDLQARRQEVDGRWVYRVALDIPAAAVRPIAGQDYADVPTERAERWVFEALRHDRAEKRAVVLHTSADCWAAQGRLTPAPANQAKIFLREGWATACDACKPEP